MIVLAVVLALAFIALGVNGYQTAKYTRPRDANDQAVQEFKRMEFQDAHATPKVSPLSLTITPTLITIPEGAICMVAKGSGAFRYGNNQYLTGAGVSGKGYKIGEAGVDVVIPVLQRLSDVDGSTALVLYVAGDGGTITFDFAFGF